MDLKFDYEVLLDFKISGITKEIAKNVCNSFTLRNLPDYFVEDKNVLFMELLNCEGVTKEIAEELVIFVGMNMDELRHTNYKEVEYIG